MMNIGHAASSLLTKRSREQDLSTPASESDERPTKKFKPNPNSPHVIDLQAFTQQLDNIPNEQLSAFFHAPQQQLQHHQNYLLPCQQAKHALVQPTICALLFSFLSFQDVVQRCKYVCKLWQQVLFTQSSKCFSNLSFPYQPSQYKWLRLDSTTMCIRHIELPGICLDEIAMCLVEKSDSSMQLLELQQQQQLQQLISTINYHNSANEQNYYYQQQQQQQRELLFQSHPTFPTVKSIVCKTLFASPNEDLQALFAMFPQLTSFTISQPSVTGEQVVQILNCVPTLRHLNLDRLPKMEQDVQFEHIVSLELEQASAGAWLRAMRMFPNLHTLKMYNTDIYATPQQQVLFQHMPLPPLKNVEIKAEHFSACTTVFLKRLKHVTSCKVEQVEQLNWKQWIMYHADSLECLAVDVPLSKDDLEALLQCPRLLELECQVLDVHAANVIQQLAHRLQVFRIRNEENQDMNLSTSRVLSQGVSMMKNARHVRVPLSFVNNLAPLQDLEHVEITGDASFLSLAHEHAKHIEFADDGSDLLLLRCSKLEHLVLGTSCYRLYLYSKCIKLLHLNQELSVAKLLCPELTWLEVMGDHTSVFVDSDKLTTINCERWLPFELRNKHTLKYLLIRNGDLNSCNNMIAWIRQHAKLKGITFMHTDPTVVTILKNEFAHMTIDSFSSSMLVEGWKQENISDTE